MTVKTTNNLIYEASKNTDEENIVVTIKLNDECKNGHEDFSITSTIYKVGKPRVERYIKSFGCCHEEILEAFPEFKLFVDLHLSDKDGIPMHVTGNMKYHLENGFNNKPIDSKEFKKEYCEYYRITEKQFLKLKELDNQILLSIALEELGILKQWKKQSNKAIKQLELLTGKKFKSTSTKSHYKKPDKEVVEAEKKKISEGYYSKESIEERKKN